MLYLTISSGELFDERTSEFITTKERTIKLEHSLISISKWESKWHETFLSNKQKTSEQVRDYVRCMTINSNVEPEVYLALSDANIDIINKYIKDPMSATWFEKEPGGGSSGEPMTSELIYYWMTAFTIPFDPCETWHLNRLLNLIKIANIKNQPKKKRSAKELASRYSAINEARKKQWGTNG